MAVDQRDGQGTHDLRGGDRRGAFGAVEQLVGAEDDVLGAEGAPLRGEQRVLVGVLHPVAQGDDLAQHPVELAAQRADVGEALLRVRVRGPLEQPVVAEVAAQQRLLRGRGDARGEGAVLDGQVEDERGEGAPDGVDVCLLYTSPSPRDS